MGKAVRKTTCQLLPASGNVKSGVLYLSKPTFWHAAALDFSRRIIRRSSRPVPVNVH
jgi:hypothetical protein